MSSKNKKQTQLNSFFKKTKRDETLLTTESNKESQVCPVSVAPIVSLENNDAASASVNPCVPNCVDNVDSNNEDNSDIIKIYVHKNPKNNSNISKAQYESKACNSVPENSSIWKESQNNYFKKQYPWLIVCSENNQLGCSICKEVSVMLLSSEFFLVFLVRLLSINK